jgi:succinate dehydrogenase / fumarate reductase cytochrome b subunit
VPDTIPDSHRIHFLLRRLHSLTGIVPIGVFLCIHLLTNSSIVWGKYLTDPHVTNPAHGGVEEFIHDVNFIHSLPMLIFIEVFGLWLPIAFHIVLGIYYAVSGRPNVGAYGYSNNWRYTLQRLSGYLGVLFIFMHVASLRWGWTFGGLLPSFSVDAAASSTALHFQAGSSLRTFIITAFYLVSVSALVFHFANGLWTAAITWGLTISLRAQRQWGFVCAGIGVVFFFVGLAGVLGFATLDVETAQQIEAQLAGGHAPVGMGETTAITP